MKAFSLVAILAVLLSYTGVRAAHLSPALTVASSAAAATDNAASADANRSQTYVGTIALLNGSLYILRDQQNDTWYHLDDQQMPAKYLGKKVAVTGQLDAGANMICVKDIEPSNS
jgi:hypothetical protein